MTSQYKMKLPFTTKEEIYDWAKRYTDRQTGAQRRVEQYLRNLKDIVQARGYLLYNELYDLVYWKLKRSRWIDKNPESCVKEITAKAFCLNDDWEKLNKLTDLKGVGESVASAILHLYDDGDYPILDQHALCSIGINYKKVNYDKPFWQEYVYFCQAKAERYDVSMRTLDRALWKYSESGTAASHSR